jgi:hypothetical protein
MYLAFHLARNSAAFAIQRSPYSFTSTLRRRIKQTESRFADNHEPFNTIDPIRTSGRHVNNHERVSEALNTISTVRNLGHRLE